MENKDKKRLLNSYRYLVRQETVLNDALEYNRQRYLTGSPKYDGMPHGTQQKDLSDYVVKAESLLNELQEVMVKKHETMQMIVRAIDRVSNDAERTLLYMKYIEGRKFEEIAVELAKISGTKKYSYRHVTRLHGSALAHFNPGVKE